jgi:hypothetical protein
MNHFHIFWIQSDHNNGNEISSIYYSKWDGIGWTQPQALYTAEQSDISQLDTAVDKERILVVWSEELDVQILFSWSSTDLAQNPSGWAPPQQLSTTSFMGMSPKILADNSGIVYVVYSKPINEDRGIYIVKSTDGGINWSDPSQAYDAEADSWDIADTPVLATNKMAQLISSGQKSFPRMAIFLRFIPANPKTRD